MTSISVRQTSCPAQIMKFGKNRSLQTGSESATRNGGRCTNASAHGRRRSSSSCEPGQRIEDFEIQAKPTSVSVLVILTLLEFDSGHPAVTGL